ncbi:MAG: hypothetical protein HC875_09740 [Anaerolineales bacterium]|nr:hypothetical protein [Anaerolineales bacterium]
MPFARGRLDATDVLLVHAWPMARLTRRGEQVEREDCWPTEADIGRPVILPGGEVGLLRSWWHAADGSEWRWSVEFYNHR